MRIAILDDYQDCIRGLACGSGSPYAPAELTWALVLATPHLGYVERDSYELYLGTAFDNVLAFARGEVVTLANPEVTAPRAP